MYKKNCPKCRKSSFSSCDTGKWICPNCHHDLTQAKLLDAEKHRKNLSPLYLIKTRCH